MATMEVARKKAGRAPARKKRRAGAATRGRNDSLKQVKARFKVNRKAMIERAAANAMALFGKPAV